MKKFLAQLLVAALLVGGAAVCVVAMVFLRPSVERSPPSPRVAVVDVMVAQPEEQVALVTGTGSVQAAQQVQVLPQVSGKVVFQSDEVLPGGRLAKGDVLVRIDARDFQLAVRQQESQVEQAELNLQLELGRQTIAAREWELLGDGRPAEDVPLALRRPQLANAERAVEAARSGLDQAKLALERTSLRAPFNALITAESVDLGQVVGPLTAVATLVGTDAFWIQVSIPVDDLAQISFPTGGDGVGSKARVVQRLRGDDIVRDGSVLRLAGALDPQTRTAQVLIEVRRPLDPLDGGLPLLPGAYVEVEIAGKTLEDTVQIPREALYGGSHVWTVTDEESLSKREVQIAWRADDTVIVDDGLVRGDRVVVSPLSLPIDGMPVRVRSTDGQTAAIDGEAR